MNMKKNPTIAELRALIGKCKDDEAHHVMWLEDNGEVHIDPIPGHLSPIGFEQETGQRMLLRYETFGCGNNYVGHEAVADEDHVNELFQDLKDGWSNKGGEGWIGGTHGG